MQLETIESVKTPRKLPDWIESFLDYTEGKPTPDIFRLWCGIACLAGAAEKRIWGHISDMTLHPNLYIMLVAPPGIGKSVAVRPVTEMWHGTKNLKIAPNSITAAAFVDSLEAAQKRVALNSSTLIEYAALNIAASEMGTLLPRHDMEILSYMNEIFDGEAYFKQGRRGFKDKEPIVITNPLLTTIIGAQPAYLASLLPEEAWGQGFMARQIMVYAAEGKDVPLFSRGGQKNEVLRAELIADLTSITRLYGEIQWGQDAMIAFAKWWEAGMIPVPTHSRLVHYGTRRKVMFTKLCMISVLSRGGSTIELKDFNRARDWLIQVEALMPDVFRDMVRKSDRETIEELHYFCMMLYQRRNKTPIPEPIIWDFLQGRVPSSIVPRIMEVATKSGLLELAPVAGPTGEKLYIPKAKIKFGYE